MSKIWGHEHRCVLYRPYANVHYGRCIGHGSVPVSTWHKQDDQNPSLVTYKYHKRLPKKAPLGTYRGGEKAMRGIPPDFPRGILGSGNQAFV